MTQSPKFMYDVNTVGWPIGSKHALQTGTRNASRATQEAQGPRTSWEHSRSETTAQEQKSHLQHEASLEPGLKVQNERKGRPKPDWDCFLYAGRMVAD